MAGTEGVVAHGLHSLFSSENGDSLVRNNGDQKKKLDWEIGGCEVQYLVPFECSNNLVMYLRVKSQMLKSRALQVEIEMLRGKNLGLYFSAAWCGPCQRFTPFLVEMYTVIASKGDFEVIFVSADDDEESFNEYFSKMPWLAVPFSDFERRGRLDELFKVRGIPHLIILDKDGKVSTNSGVDIVRDYGAEGYPFTSDRRDQSLRSIMGSFSLDFVISSNEEKVPVSELEGMVVGLYFSMFSYDPCVTFTAKLVDVYDKLKANGERFEIVLISLDQDEELFKQGLRNIPWFALPFRDKSCDKLVRYFELSSLPTLVIVGQNGKTLQSNVVEAIEEHGVQAYPFTVEKIAELEKAKEEAQTLESILVLGEHDFVIGKDGAKIPVSNLVGRNILLYFSADWCPNHAFLPKLIEAYHNIKKKDDHDGLEVIFISSDRDELSFNETFSRMPWLAIPYGDPRKASLRRKFKVQVEGITTLIAIGADGCTVTKDAKQLISTYGAKAYPFTAARVEELKSKIEEMAKNWPHKLKHTLHEEHQLLLARRRVYICDGCEKEGRLWSYLCKECDFDLHPKCALENRPEYQNGMEEWSC